MQEYDALKQKAAHEPKDEDVAKDLQAARSKAAEAASLASKINRDAAADNQKSVIQHLQKAVNDEMAKPAADRDQVKIALLQAVMKPTYQLSAQEKQLVAGLTECMKPEGQADKKVIDQLAGTLKDKSVLFDAVGAYSTIQQAEFQKQAVNQARLAMLDVDVAFDKGEKNPLVGEIEKDKYGGELIAALNSVPGHDGRTQWGDIKEATRELGWGESIWKFAKGTLKEVAIAFASWGVGALAGIGAAAALSWSGPGAVIGGAAVGFAAGAATGSAIRYALGDKVTLTGVALDGISGLTGGVTGTTFAVARGFGAAAVKSVIAQQAERGVVIGADQTFAAFKAAGLADKVAIAAGGSRFLASFTAATAGSIAYRIPTEALTGNYQNFGDYAEGTAWKIAKDVPLDLASSYFMGRRPTAYESAITNPSASAFYGSARRQLAGNFLWSSPEAKSFSTTPQARRSPFNAPVYDWLQGKPKDATDK
jgi:hypothetical protein